MTRTTVVAIPHDGKDELTYRINVHDHEGHPSARAADFGSYSRGRLTRG
jgi:hypothetical protein